MDIMTKFTCSDIDWKLVSSTLKEVGMGYYSPDLHKKAFENSFATVFLYHEASLIGFGRAMCDGAYQAAIYDIAVAPSYQGKGLGKMIMDNILAQLPPCNIILYASPGKEGFYEKYSFRKMKTGMAAFMKADKMADKGFTE